MDKYGKEAAVGEGNSAIQNIQGPAIIPTLVLTVALFYTYGYMANIYVGMVQC